MALTACPACRALFDSRLSRCPECGASLAAKRLREKGGVFDRARSRRLEANLLVIGVNVVLYVLALYLSREKAASGGWLGGFGRVNLGTMYDLGGLTWPAVAQKGEWWRLVCPIFLHFDLIHIGFNCLVIRIVGRLAEEVYGPAKFLTLYLLTGIAGTLGSLLYHWGNPTFIAAGASGAAFGLMGLMAVYGFRSGNEAIKQTMVRWAVFALLFGMLMGADNAAHLAGLGAGVGVAFLVSTAERTRLRPFAVRAWDLAGILCAVLVATSFAMALA